MNVSSLSELGVHLLPQDAADAWRQYVVHEADGLRTQALAALAAFLELMAGESPATVWSWVRAVGENVLDAGLVHEMRFPLIRDIVFPELLAASRRDEPDAARWLASLLERSANRSSALWARLEPDEQHPIPLLKRALALDPTDHRARAGLIDAQASELLYSLHVLPHGVLFGLDGATIEECALLRGALEEFVAQVAIAGVQSEYATLITECRYHFTAYEAYRRAWQPGDTYPAFLERHPR